MNLKRYTKMTMAFVLIVLFFIVTQWFIGVSNEMHLVGWMLFFGFLITLESLDCLHAKLNKLDKIGEANQSQKP